MFLNTIFLNLKKTYIIFFIILLFIILTISQAHSFNFKVNNIRVKEPFNSNFKKNKVIDKAVVLAFEKLLSMTISTNEMHKISSYKVNELKNLIDSFNIKDEQFINETYNATFEINFNKQNTFLYIEKKNIYPSIPNIKKVMVLPILVDPQLQSVNIFNKNPFYTHWNSYIKDYHLINYILPSEDIDVVKALNDNFSNLEEYDFSDIIQNYNINEYIICLIYKEKEEENLKVFSKIKFGNKLKIRTELFEIKNINSSRNLEKFIDQIKVIYEDELKRVNQINRSVKLPINLSISSSDYIKNDRFENFLSSTDLVSEYIIKDFDNNYVNYKIIFNGSPRQFLDIAKNKNFLIDTDQHIWKVK